MKALVLLLTALILLTPAAMAGEAVPAIVTIDFAGNYVAFPAHNFMLFLPSDWTPTESTPSRYATGAADGSISLVIDIRENTSGLTLDALLADFERNPTYTKCEPVYYGAAPFVKYISQASKLLGAATISSDGAFLYFFTFSPYANGQSETLVTQVMSSVCPIQ